MRYLYFSYNKMHFWCIFLAEKYAVTKTVRYQPQKDRNGVDFVDGQKLFPIVNDGKDANGYHTGKNYIDKIVTVKNTGTEDAYIRTHIAVPHVLDDGADTFNASDNILHWQL